MVTPANDIRHRRVYTLITDGARVLLFEPDQDKHHRSWSLFETVVRDKCTYDGHVSCHNPGCCLESDIEAAARSLAEIIDHPRVEVLIARLTPLSSVLRRALVPPASHSFVVPVTPWELSQLEIDLKPAGILPPWSKVRVVDRARFAWRLQRVWSELLHTQTMLVSYLPAVITVASASAA